MNKISIVVLKTLRKLYLQSFAPGNLVPECEQNPDSAAKLIYDTLNDDKPCLIARFGSVELFLLVNYLGVKNNKGFKNVLPFIKGKIPAWWWEPLKIHQIQSNAGFFPNDINKIEQFCQLFIEEIPNIDILGSWLPEERFYENELHSCRKVHLELLNPYFSTVPWTKALEGKKVLVIHPFAQTIERQFKKREQLFANQLLPEFGLETIQAVQSIAGSPTHFKDWFEAFDYMKFEIERKDFDICLIGAGAYGLPLAAHVKKLGKKGFHIGGSLQLLFGIKGKRWENPNYNPHYNYAKLMNEHWVKPSEDEKPKKANIVEGACYW